MYESQDIDDVLVIDKVCDDDISLKVSETTIANVHKAPNTQWSYSVLPVFEHPYLHVGYHSQSNYSLDDYKGTCLASWTEQSNLSQSVMLKTRLIIIYSKDVGATTQICVFVLVNDPEFSRK